VSVVIPGQASAVTEPEHSSATVPAPFGRRAFARLFDIVVVAVVAVPVLALTVRDGRGDAVPFPLVVIVLYAVLPAVWEAHMVARRGATPGKQLSGLVVVRVADGGRPSLLSAVARSAVAWSVPATAVLVLGGPLVALAIVGVYGPAAVPGLRRDLPDLVSGTRVVFAGDLVDHAPDEGPGGPG